MNKYVIFVSIFIISLIYSVTCDDPEEVKRFGLNRARQSYRFNHPPAAEDYERIPVAVVYDKVIDRTNRRQNLEKPVTGTKAKVSSPVIKDTVTLSNSPKNINKEEVTTTETSVNTAEISTDNINKPESREIKLALKIPVSVVYDDEPGFVKTNRINSGVSTRLRKTSQRQRKPTAEPDEQTILTIKPFFKNGSQFESDVKPVNSIFENEKPSLSKSSQDEKSKMDLNGSKTRRRNSRRRPQSKKADSNIVKVSSENGTQQKLEQITQTQINKSNVLKENGDQEKPIQIQMTESRNQTNDSNQEPSKNIPKPEIKISKVSTEGELEKKREHGEPDPVVPIVASENLVYGNTGEFKYSYEGGDGTKAFSKGKLKSFDDEVTGEAVEGGFSYKDKEGNNFSLSYTADENGYRPVGAHLPTPPPIPPAIARALAYLATKTTPEPITESINEQEENTPAPHKRL